MIEVLLILFNTRARPKSICAFEITDKQNERRKRTKQVRTARTRCRDVSTTAYSKAGEIHTNLAFDLLCVHDVNITLLGLTSL